MIQLQEMPYIQTYTPHQLELMRRRQRAWQLRQQGMTLEAIGRVLGVTNAQVCRDVKRIEQAQQQQKRSA